MDLQDGTEASAEQRQGWPTSNWEILKDCDMIVGQVYKAYKNPSV